MANSTAVKPNKLGANTWISIVLFGLMGQLAWMVENMYFSTFIQKQITTNPWATSATVTASAITAALVTIFGGALTDRVGKRKVFVCWGYIIWGAITASFAFFGNEHFGPDQVVAVVVIFVIMDCVMTVFGSMSNDAAFSAWVTDVTDITNRGFVDVILSIMPVAALMIIFVGFDGLTQDGKWTLFFIILGAMTMVAGVVGLFILKDSPSLKPDKSSNYMSNVVYGFQPKNVKKHGMIYVCLIGMMLSGLAMQMWQPYMIMMLQYTLGFGEGFVLPLAIVILLSAVVAVLGGKLMDKYGKEAFFYPVAAAGVVGGVLVYLIKFVGGNYGATFALFVVGGTLIESASLLAAGLFNATARDYTPSDKAGCFQGIRIIIFVTLPMIIASIFCPLIIESFGAKIDETLLAELSKYGNNLKVGDYYYPFELFIFSAVAAALMFVPTYFVRKHNKKLREQKLNELQTGQTVVDATADVVD